MYSASKAPDPVDYQSLSIGTPRETVVNTLGSPSYSNIKVDNTQITSSDNFKFINGYPTAYKSRVLLYLAGDFFSAGLSEIIFWPMEEYWLQGSENNAVVEYDNKDKLKNISIFSGSDHTLLYQKP